MPPPIRLENLSYAIDGAPILDAIDLTVHPQEIVAIMGRSGTGKTTLLRLIMGLVKPAAGRISINGTDITDLGETRLDEIRAKMGMVFQGAALFDSMTVAENVGFALVEHRLLPAEDIDARVRELLAMVDMAGTEHLLPAQLSGGMRKRVGIARALAQDPAIVLYDEPTAGLDPISAAAIDALIVRLRDQVGVTSVIVSHDVQSLRRVADRAAMLHHGRFLAVGTLPELEESPDPAVRQFLSGSPEGPMTEGAAPASGG
ncbi:MAG TPA: ABC transporter ATP-binding protein [Armatimonadota bacterium]|nr:ABC transporter ATP-binding protein [Armatimonadota bacterium]